MILNIHPDKIIGIETYAAEKLKNLIPKNYTQEQREDFIRNACIYYGRYLERKRAMER